MMVAHFFFIDSMNLKIYIFLTF